MGRRILEMVRMVSQYNSFLLLVLSVLNDIKTIIVLTHLVVVAKSMHYLGVVHSPSFSRRYRARRHQGMSDVFLTP